MSKNGPKHKYMQVLDREMFRCLEREANARGITVQELTRAVIVPDWLYQLPSYHLLNEENRNMVVKHQQETARTARAFLKSNKNWLAKLKQKGVKVIA